MEKKFKTPILFLIFNRLDTTEKVFAEIRKSKPNFLYIASDGPRENKEGEKIIVEKTRKIVLDMIDWDCEVKTLFREKNLGCKMAVSGAINWFFEHVEEGIILEDDCLPSQSFFKFCEEMLDRYRKDERIMIISGFNKQGVWNLDKNDYFFSNLGGIWGWATWKRAWKYYDGDRKKLNAFIRGNYFEYILGRKLGNIRKKQIINGSKDNWDFSWGFARHLNSGMACVPNKSLIQNIGFGVNATHTVAYSKDSRIKAEKMNFPMRENNIVVADRKYDELFFKPNYSYQLINILSRIKNKLKSI